MIGFYGSGPVLCNGNGPGNPSAGSSGGADTTEKLFARWELSPNDIMPSQWPHMSWGGLVLPSLSGTSAVGKRWLL